MWARRCGKLRKVEKVNRVGIYTRLGPQEVEHTPGKIHHLYSLKSTVESGEEKGRKMQALNKKLVKKTCPLEYTDRLINV